MPRAHLQDQERIDTEWLSVLRRLVLAGQLVEPHALQALARSGLAPLRGAGGVPEAQGGVV